MQAQDATPPRPAGSVDPPPRQPFDAEHSPTPQRPPRSTRFDSPRSRSHSLASSTEPDSLATTPSISQHPSTGPNTPKPARQATPPQQRQQQRHEDSLGATWTEMQNTLEEVELNAASGDRGGSAFSASHARALDELRSAQIALAQAWGRSEAEDETLLGDDDSAGNTHERQQRGAVLGGGDDRARGDGRAGADADGKSQLEAETENDILLARRRRLANDRYFERVNKGVVDVVERLEAVAKRMRGVEMEAQGIWDDRDSLESDSA